MRDRNYYEILGVSQETALDEIKKQYRRLVKIYHPDSGGDNSNVAEFRKVIAAWDVISDSEKRVEYDKKIHADQKREEEKKEKEKRNREEEAKKRAEKKRAVTPQNVSSASGHESTHYSKDPFQCNAQRKTSHHPRRESEYPVYGGLEWKVFSKQETGKKVFSYKESLEQIQAGGFERPPYSYELFNLIITAMKNQFFGDRISEVYLELLGLSDGVWLGDEVEVRGQHSFVAYRGLSRKTFSFPPHRASFSMPLSFPIHVLQLSEEDVTYWYGEQSYSFFKERSKRRDWGDYYLQFSYKADRIPMSSGDYKNRLGIVEGKLAAVVGVRAPKWRS